MLERIWVLMLLVLFGLFVAKVGWLLKSIIEATLDNWLCIWFLYKTALFLLYIKLEAFLAPLFDRNEHLSDPNMIPYETSLLTAYSMLFLTLMSFYRAYWSIRCSTFKNLFSFELKYKIKLLKQVNLMFDEFLKPLTLNGISSKLQHELYNFFN